MVLLLTLFLLYELSSTVEAKALPTKADNVTVVTKTGRHLTIGKQGITGEFSSNPYGKNFLLYVTLKDTLHNTIFAQNCRMQPAYNLSCMCKSTDTIHLCCRRIVSIF